MDESTPCLLAPESAEGIQGYSTSEEEKTAVSFTNRPERKRWYILGLFSVYTFVQALIWNTWGPISTSASFVFGWDNSTIALLSNWISVGGILSFPFFTWVLPVKGLRWSCLSALCVATVGTALRCITSEPPAATLFIHSGQLVNALGAGLWGGAIPLLSSVWFPANQRTTATAISLSLQGVGISFSFVVGPALVPDVNTSICPNFSVAHANLSTSCIQHKKEILSRIMILMYSEFAATALLFLAMLIYYPARPKNAPSTSSTVNRIGIKESLWSLLRNFQFWLLTIMFSVSGGVYLAWGSVLHPLLQPLKISQISAAWLGFWGTLAGQISSIFVGLFADLFSKRTKQILLMSCIFGTIACVVLCLQIVKVIPPNTALLYVNNIFVGISMYGSGPLFYEAVCETTFPVSEAVSNTIMVFLSNITGFIVLMLFFIPNIGITWISWTLLASTALCIPLVLCYQERYYRLDIDMEVQI